MHSSKHWISIIVGLVLLVLGLLPLLNTLGVSTGVDFHKILGGALAVFSYLVAFGGLYLIWDSFHEIGSLSPAIGWLSLVVGFIVFALGLLQALSSLKVIALALPAFPALVYYIIFVIEGILLFIAGFLD